MNERLNPLQQRLFLYGFTYVQMDPFSPIDEDTWQIPGLQSLLEPRFFHGWCGILRRCRPFSETAHQPVISPSLRGLLRLRQRSPLRPLILCQTAFEPVFPAAKLRHLARPNRQLGKLLDRNDPLHPLYWVGCRPRLLGREVRAWSGLERHPFEELLMRLVREHPQSQIWIQEDGRLLEQPSLFATHRKSPPTTSFRRQLAHFEGLFREQWAGFKGSAYVFSRSRARLAWFRRDCLRLLGTRICCWPFPCMPDPRDPLPHLILVRDQHVRLTRLERVLPCYFLDGEERRNLFRQYRVGNRKGPRWIAETEPRTAATHRTQGRELVFWLTEHGWQSQSSGGSALAHKDELFAQHLEMMLP